MVSILCCVNHKLSARVRHDTRFYRPVVDDLDGIQVVLGVQSLERLENIPILLLCFHVTIFKGCNSFL